MTTTQMMNIKIMALIAAMTLGAMLDDRNDHITDCVTCAEDSKPVLVKAPQTVADDDFKGKDA